MHKMGNSIQPGERAEAWPLCALEIGMYHTVIPAQLLTNFCCEVYGAENYDQQI